MTLIGLLLESTERLTPLSTLTVLSGYLTEKPLGPVTQFLIKRFISSFNINMAEVADPNLKNYKTFNDFFTRKLKEEVRPIDPSCKAISPVDGTVGQADLIDNGRLIQAKGLDYSLEALLGGSTEDARLFASGTFACIYLSPSNYHRIHMPTDGRLIKTVHIPGKHFPVGQNNIKYLANLYTRNERLACFFDTALGPFCVVMVGAALVGSIATSWGGTLKRHSTVTTQSFEKDPPYYKKGEEIGLFKYGSTVICLWNRDGGTLDPAFKCQTAVKMGQKMII